jgi:hypothetical protein
MIIDTPLQDCIQIREGLVNLTRYFSDYADLLRIGQTRKGAGYFI